jgi:hypothetical protein
MNTTPLASIGIDIGKEVSHVVGFGTAHTDRPEWAQSSRSRSR